MSLLQCKFTFTFQQYQDAIKAHKAGRKVDFDELPTPPGYCSFCFCIHIRCLGSPVV